MRYLFLLIIVVLAGCSSGVEIDPSVACQVDDDCVPEKVCHPTKCLNSEYVEEPEEMMFCTLEYRAEAAYNADDCLCIEGACVNKNAQN